MTHPPIKIPFVDLSIQHKPLEAEIDQAILQVIRQGDFILGQKVTEFETNFATASGVKYGIGVSSGTEAIALGLKSCGITKDDEVIVPANTFIATIMGVIKAGAKPVFVDCDLETALIDIEAAAKAITPQTKAIIPVHLYGQMVSPSQLLDFAKTYNLFIFEDAAQAHLADREGYHAGSIGKAAAFSFYPSKNLGAFGNGGMVITNDQDIVNKVKNLRNYGASSKYFHTEIGSNSRLDTIQAAVLSVKLPHLKTWNQSRNQAAKNYDQQLTKLEQYGIIPIKNYSETGHIYHLYVIRIKDSFPLSRDQVISSLSEHGIQTGIHYPIPCHLQPGYQYLGYHKGDFPNTEILANQIISLPMYPGLNSSQIDFVCEQLFNLSQTSRSSKY
jgi:dTDP-4-amino-4,6-dideoxygalactose transaminase